MRTRPFFLGLAALAAAGLSACGGRTALPEILESGGDATADDDSGSDGGGPTSLDATTDAPTDAPPLADDSGDAPPLADDSGDSAPPADAADADTDADAEAADAADAGTDAAVCAPGTEQCSGSTAVETCGANGQWGSPVECRSQDPVCLNGACVPAAPSCLPGGAGMTNCGADGGESCCASLEVTGGSYFRTYTSDGNGAAIGEADPATVSGFRLDKYIVTVGRFRQFVSAALPPDGGASWTPPEGSGKHTHLNGGLGLASGPAGDGGQTYEPGWVTSDDANIAPTTFNLDCPSLPYDTWTSAAGSQENLPMTCMTWAEAYAFCIWDGGFLPSEAEWEYAAAGGSQQLEYPWGSTAPGASSQYAIYGCEYPPGIGGGLGDCTGVSNIAPVGAATLGAGVWGQLDLAGGVWEWTLDAMGSYFEPCADCAYLATSSARVIRGGGYNNSGNELFPPYRADFGPPVEVERGGALGIRCARTP